MIENLNGQI